MLIISPSNWAAIWQNLVLPDVGMALEKEDPNEFLPLRTNITEALS
jgi:hypothetical protein